MLIAKWIILIAISMNGSIVRTQVIGDGQFPTFKTQGECVLRMAEYQRATPRLNAGERIDFACLPVYAAVEAQP